MKRQVNLLYLAHKISKFQGDRNEITDASHVEALIPYPREGNIEIFWQKRFAQLYGNSVSWHQREPSDLLVIRNLLL